MEITSERFDTYQPSANEPAEIRDETKLSPRASLLIIVAAAATPWLALYAFLR